MPEDASFFEEEEKTNKKVGALTAVTSDLTESNKKLTLAIEKQTSTAVAVADEDASFFDSGAPDGSSKSKALSVEVVKPSAQEAQRGKINLAGVGAAGLKEKEDEADEPTEDEEERTTLLGKMAGYLGEQAKRAKKVAMTGIKGFLSTVAIGGFLILLGKFLQSDYFKMAMKFIKEDLLPGIKKVWDALGIFGPIIATIGGFFLAKGALSLFGVLTGISGMFKLIRNFGKKMPKVPKTLPPPKTTAPPKTTTTPKGGQQPPKPKVSKIQQIKSIPKKVANIPKAIADKRKKIVAAKKALVNKLKSPPKTMTMKAIKGTAKLAGKGISQVGKGIQGVRAAQAAVTSATRAVPPKIDIPKPVKPVIPKVDFKATKITPTPDPKAKAKLLADKRKKIANAKKKLVDRFKSPPKKPVIKMPTPQKPVLPKVDVKATPKPPAVKPAGGGGAPKPKPIKIPPTPKTPNHMAKAIKMFPKFGMLGKVAKRIPILGQVMAVGQLAMILAGDAPASEKAAGVAGILGGLGGATLGAIVGGTVGSVVPVVGNLIGGAAGGLLGYMAGETIATGLAQWMLGEKVTAFPDAWYLPDINSMFNGKEEEKGGAAGGDAKKGDGGTPPPEVKGEKIKASGAGGAGGAAKGKALMKGGGKGAAKNGAIAKRRKELEEKKKKLKKELGGWYMFSSSRKKDEKALAAVEKELGSLREPPTPSKAAQSMVKDATAGGPVLSGPGKQKEGGWTIIDAKQIIHHDRTEEEAKQAHAAGLHVEADQKVMEMAGWLQKSEYETMKHMERTKTFADDQGGWKVVGDAQRKFIADYESGALPHQQKQQAAIADQPPKTTAEGMTPAPAQAVQGGPIIANTSKTENQTVSYGARQDIKNSKFQAIANS